jgi:DNA polymerase IIIc chi subunit
MEDQSQSKCDSRKTWNMEKEKFIPHDGIESSNLRSKKRTVKTSWPVRWTASKGVEIKTNGEGKGLR